ncbi:unnamed protein product [Calypogeia fissa]
MPRISERQKALKAVREKVMLNILLQSSSEDMSSESDVNSLANIVLSDSQSDHDLYSSSNSEVVADMLELEGMPGSCFDLQCFKRTSLCKQQNNGRLFSRSQYILGDSGYSAMPHVVAAYKRAESIQEREEFNLCVAKCRVTNEHCIGVLKSRWHSLRGMRIQLKSKAEKAWLVRWIIMCGRLHNYVLSRDDVWTEEDEVIILDNEDSDDDMDELADLAPIDNANPQPAEMNLQASITEYARQFHRQPGGCLSDV